MDFNLENFIPARNLEVLRNAGMHKVAGVMADVPELTVKEAVAIIGAKAYLRRREMAKIATGLEALADAAGEKVAGSAWDSLLSRAMTPALGGGAIAVLPKLLSREPTDTQDLMTSFGMGAGLGGLGSMGMNLNRAFKNPDLNQHMTSALGG